MKRDEIEKLTNEFLKAELLADLCDFWACVGCGWWIRLQEPRVVGNVCCGGCGYALLRPIHESDKQVEAQKREEEAALTMPIEEVRADLERLGLMEAANKIKEQIIPLVQELRDKEKK